MWALARVPDETADSFPGTMSDFAERAVTAGVLVGLLALVARRG